MRHVVQRPPAAPDPGDGFLRQSHFQVAYVTNDIARAREVLSKRYGLTEFLNTEGDMPGGGYMKVALAWAGPTMYELIEAEGPAADFYNRRLPAEGFAIRHHHLGYYVETQAGWDALTAKIADEGWRVVFGNDVEGFIHFVYIEAPELEHYLEYIYPEPAGVEFMQSIPNN